MPRLITPGLAYRHLKRYRHVIGVLVKYGFGEFFGQIRLWEYGIIERRLLRREYEFAHLTHAQRLRLAMEELGPTFVKLGQMLSTRPDLVPHDFIVEFENLQNRVAPIPASAAREVIQSELGRPINELFPSFEDQPLAAASLAQVHRATYQGHNVVLKVQRPHIAEIIGVDLDIMLYLANLIERHIPQAYIMNPVGMVKEFAENIRKELDFKIEANNMRRFAQNFAGTAWLHVPAVYHELCTRRVLVMEYIDGINVSEVERLQREGYDLQLIARRGVEIGLKSTLEHGFFHADPHPGNIFILPDNVICLLDYGMMGTVSARQRERLGRMLYHIGNRDERRIARSLLDLMESSEVADAEELETDVSNIIQEYGFLPLSEMRLGTMVFRLLRLLQSHRVRFHAHLVWLAKAIATIEDIAHKLKADFNMIEFARPYARRLLSRSLSPVRQPREFFYSLVDSLELIKDLPYDAGIILHQLKKGRVKIEFEHIGLEPFRQTLNRVSNRIALTIFLAALLIASSLIVLAGLPPLVASIPVIGLVGFFFSAIIAIWLIVSIILRG